MSIKKHPHSGQIVICNFAGYIVPEIVKRRPVVVISPKPRQPSGLCAVIPLSTTEPRIIEPHHIRIAMPQEIVRIAHFSTECWAKCDLVYTVSLARIDLIRLGRNKEGARQYSYARVDENALESIRSAAIFCLTGRA